MKQVININFHGQVVPIEVSAFEILKNYTKALSNFFANEPGKEEIINDIESRIAELFQQRLKKGATCITDDDVNAIIKSMGMPEDFENDEAKVTSTLGNTESNTNANANTASNAKPQRVYRDENNKILGGVCSGIANYMGVDPVLVRAVFAILLFAFGTGILAYIILWVIVPSSATNVIGAVRKKLFRDADDKMLAGVCSGIGKYFGINPWIPRTLFLIPFITFAFRWHDWGVFDFPSLVNLTFSPGSLFVYIISWLVIPEALTTSEKLEMKGEKVDMNSIKNSVMEEMKGVQKRAQGFAAEASNVASEKGKVFNSEIRDAAPRVGKSFGDVIVFIAKGFFYFITGIVALSCIVALFALAITSVGIFPLKDFVITDGWQNAMAWGTLLFFIAVPVIGIITWIIRKLTKAKGQSKLLRAAFISMWIIGWFCCMSLIASVVKDFRSVNNTVKEDIYLSNPGVDRLELINEAKQNNKEGYKYGIFRVEPFENIDEDTAYVRNVEIIIKKSQTDSFSATMMKMANGRNRRTADTLAQLINYKATQQGNLLLVDRGIAINTHDKFRNQRIVLTIYVPVGKQIKVDKSVGWGNDVHISGPWRDDWNDWDSDDEERGWHENVDYIMRADGLHTLDGKPANKWNNDINDKDINIDENGIDIKDGDKRIRIDENGIRVEKNKGKYHYDDDSKNAKIDSVIQKLNNEKERLIDSMQKSMQEQHEKINQQIKTATIEPIAVEVYKLPYIFHGV